ncbi:hypothetical protein ACQ4LE_003652 [Meloidogyne hapla]|uniref:F-box domain-containing protein n=1 Tax=Meloidogyne hapla TaxID=6305 RepID=A0A1I8AXR0_MELHA
MYLDELPIELLLLIFDYLPPDDLWCNFRAVNRRLNLLIREQSYWLKRANHRYGLVLPERLRDYPPETNDADDSLSTLSPIYRCIATEQAAIRCSDDHKGFVQSVSTLNAHFGIIHTIRLFTTNGKYFCLTGARDRQIILWDLRSAIYNDWTNVPIEKAHDGWVWSISCPKYNANSFFSAGWDSIVKKWQIAEASIRPIQKIPVGTAALSCISENENILYVSTYRSGPLLYDTRAPCTSPLASNNCHGQRSVFELATMEDCNQVFSIGDDKQLAAVDKRRFESLVGTYHSNESISHVDYEDRQLCLSLKNGHFLFFNPETLKLENELIVTNDDDGSRLKGDQNIRVTRGGTFCACSDNSMRVFSPGVQPQQMAKLKINENLTIDVLDDHIVASTATGAIHYWPNIDVLIN